MYYGIQSLVNVTETLQSSVECSPPCLLVCKVIRWSSSQRKFRLQGSGKGNWKGGGSVDVLWSLFRDEANNNSNKVKNIKKEQKSVWITINSCHANFN